MHSNQLLLANSFERRLIQYGIIVDDRDTLVREAYEAGVAKNRISTLSGIARTTIDRILADA